MNATSSKETPIGGCLERLVRHTVNCRRCGKTQIVRVGTNEYFLLLNDITENGVVVSPWTWAAVNKQHGGRMATEHLCRPCRGTEIKEACELIRNGKPPNDADEP